MNNFYCKRCVLPRSKPGLKFDDEGICSACRSVDKKYQINWRERSDKLMQICDEIRNKNKGGYDCIVPVSGGKDGTYQVYLMSKVYKLKTLAVTLQAHVQTKEGIENLNALVSSYNCDLLKVIVRPSTLRKMKRIAFFEIGNPNYAEHRVIFSSVARTALFYNVPLVVWGEDIGFEFGGNISKSSNDSGSAEDLINNDLFRESKFDHFISGRIDKKELFFFEHPDINELKKQNIKSIYLGYFHWWDGYKHYLISKSTGFKGREKGNLSGNIINYDNIDEKLCEITIWMKFLKLGFWRPHDSCGYKIWNGYMSRKQAVEYVKEIQYQFPYEYLDEFLDYYQLTKTEFNENLDKWRNLDLWEKKGNNWRLKYEIS
tara:strand:+ start:2487 stop:3605 length:1119 start_codon:yes stop_codon:yes gene_type:complete